MQKLITDDQIHEIKLWSLKAVKLLWLTCREWKGEKGTDFIYDRLTHICGHQQSNFQTLSVNTGFLFIASLRRVSPEDKT